MDTPAQVIAEAITSWQPDCAGRDPLVVAIDGHGAAGKSTITRRLSEQLDVAVVHTDDFFRPSQTRAQAAARDPRPMAGYYDWQRLREEALEPLLSGRAAMYRAFDEAPDVYRDNLTVVRPAAVVVLEGVSAASPALEDLVDRVVLVQTSEAERLSRLRRLIPADAWDDEWLAAEQRYFASFQDATVDLLVTGEAH